MNTVNTAWVLMVLCCAGPTLAAAQQTPTNPPAPAKQTAQSEAGEPRADTSSAAASAPAVVPAPAAPDSRTKAATGAAGTRTPVPGTGSSTMTTAPDTVTAAPAAAGAPARIASPARVPAGTPAAGSRAAAAPGPKAPGAADRLQLGTATVTGSQEQPKVMYIVPWKRSDIGDLAGKPMNSLVDEILAPVDREVFKREVVYYQAVQADASQNGAPPKASQQGEK